LSNRTQLKIRQFEIADQEIIRHLVLEGLSEHFDSFDSERNPDLDNIANYYLKAGNYFVVAEQEDVLIGSGALIGETVDRGRIVRMSIAKTYRGQGAGAAIVNHLISEAILREYSTIAVETNHDWEAAISLYIKCGFVQCASDEESIHMILEL
jgi:ribosomal protein S18 acetylase RimI-like enzyme